MDQLNWTHGAVAGAVLLGATMAHPYIMQALNALPNYLTRRAKARFDAAVAAGKIPPQVARLASALKRATFEWADKEFPASVGPDKMATVLAALERLPFVGALVAADAAGVQEDLQAEYNAARAEVAAEAAADKAKADATAAAAAAAAAGGADAPAKV